MAHAYPLMLDITNRALLIVGGGTVAVRKAKGLLAAGAMRVTAVAPHFSDNMPTTITRHLRIFQSSDLTGISLVFVATDSHETNDAIAAEARRRNILFNRCDTEEGDSDFATPAVLRRGPITLTVSSGGSPALAAKLRDHLDSALDNSWSSAAEAMQSLRPSILACVADSKHRQEIFHALTSDEALAAAGHEGPEGLRRYAIHKFPELREG